jgi:hypothetical protein
MHSFDRFDWSRGSAEAHLAMARRGTENQVRALARRYDWSMYPETVLGWIMAQKFIDLGTALTAFLNGEPERFNYLPKRDVPDTYRGAARVLDNICLRVNSGFYLASAEHDVSGHGRIARWLEYQAADREEGRRGRWILDEEIVAVLTDDRLRAEAPPERPAEAAREGRLRRLFTPLWG